jgi:spermidine/putrescine transport system permease protein
MSNAAEIARRGRAQEIKGRWLLSAPALLTILCAGVGPLFVVLLYSFMVKGDYGDVKYWQFSLDGWTSVVFSRDPIDDTLGLADANLLIFWRSIRLAFLTTIGALLIGFPTSYFMATRNVASRNVWLFLITIPFWTNLLIRTFAIMELIRNEGIINITLMKLGIVSEPVQILFTDTAVLIGLVYVYLPLMVLPIYASLEKLDFRLVEAGYDLYATRPKVLWNIVVPHARPGIIAGCILVFIPAIGAYVTPRVLGGGKQLMLGNLVAQQFGQARNWPLGSALSITLLVIVTTALIIYVRSASRNGVEDGH